MSRSKLEELSVFPLPLSSSQGGAEFVAARLLDELRGNSGPEAGAPVPEFSPELRSRILDLVAGTCRKSCVT